MWSFTLKVRPELLKGKPLSSSYLHPPRVKSKLRIKGTWNYGTSKNNFEYRNNILNNLVMTGYKTFQGLDKLRLAISISQQFVSKCKYKTTVVGNSLLCQFNLKQIHRKQEKYICLSKRSNETTKYTKIFNYNILGFKTRDNQYTWKRKFLFYRNHKDSNILQNI